VNFPLAWKATAVITKIDAESLKSFLHPVYVTD
jgi:hypothetical protein